MIEEHPESEYARSSILKFDLAFDHLGGKEMEVGRYYLKRQNYQAAANRFRVVVEQFQTTSHTPEALYRLIECYLALGLTEDAQTAGAILGYNFQSTVWYEDGFALLTGQGLQARGAADGMAVDDLSPDGSGPVAVTGGGADPARLREGRCCVRWISGMSS